MSYSRKYIIFILGIMMGILAITQYHAFRKVEELVVRDSSVNIFTQIQSLKRNTEELRREIEELEVQLEQSSNTYAARELVLKEIEKMENLLGKKNIKGQGINVLIPFNIQVTWLTDIINALWNAGAEGISINKIRLTPNNVGFSEVGHSQILLNGNLLVSPYNLAAIGNQDVLEKVLTQNGGVLSQMSLAYPNLKVGITTDDEILMKAI